MAWRIGRLGEDALLLEADGGMDAAINARVHALARQLESARPAWLRDIVPGYGSLALFVDDDAGADDPLARAEAWLRGRLDAMPEHSAAAPVRVVEIPVRYGGEDGPDLEDVARHAGLAPEEVIARHAGGDYTVAMLGFAPGFPYLLGLDPALATPRRATPRTRVPAGSVAIGGAQAGLYPQDSPGGWQLIGRTDLVLFDALRDPPSLLAPGDRVRFVPVRAR
ncbi:MAG TPA: 5-oxoprolinase subunit PxpB [Xanthomonadaceae bacterium]|nr:5-oxoprolinase subunit PxpB [Xanthomonadaceae bacterium]